MEQTDLCQSGGLFGGWMKKVKGLSKKKKNSIYT